MAGVHSRFGAISEAEILKIQEDAVPENTEKATKSVVEITEWVYTKTIIVRNCAHIVGGSSWNVLQLV